MAIHAVAIALGSLLLFAVQPLLGRLLLPWYGGGIGVWLGCLAFFQTALLAGYLWSHLIVRWLSRRAQIAAHLALAIAALAQLPVAPAPEWRPTGEGEPLFAVWATLAASAGLPLVVCAANAPLLQAWLADRRGGSVYRLYAVSNLGSFAALVAYPFAVEPFVGLDAQARAWSAGFGALALALVLAAVQSAPRAETGIARPGAGKRAPAAPAGRDAVGRWLALSALGAILLHGCTNQMCQEIASVPLLWVLPLSLYLLSYVLCFDRPAWAEPGTWLALHLAGALAVVWLKTTGAYVPIHWQVAIVAAALFAGCVLCHGELYRLRPPPRRLTAFYLAIAVGGVAGGLAVTLVAPVVLDDYHELDAALVAAPIVVALSRARAATGALAGFRPREALAAVVVVALGAGAWSVASEIRLGEHVLARSRNFHGTLLVVESGRKVDEGILPSRQLRSGEINHGEQFDAPLVHGEPTTYFTLKSGIGVLLRSLPTDRPIHLGVLGLGTGTLAAYGQAKDRIRFYEIDPAAIEFARSWFDFLDESPAEIGIVRGDARLSLEREEAQDFDVLVMDAFQGDAVPVHLLTLEAFGTYLRHLAPEGVIAVNTSNQHLDFRRLLVPTARALGLRWLYVDRKQSDVEGIELSSAWFLLARDPTKLERIAAFGTAIPDDLPWIEPWTDDHASVVPLLY